MSEDQNEAHPSVIFVSVIWNLRCESIHGVRIRLDTTDDLFPIVPRSCMAQDHGCGDPGGVLELSLTPSEGGFDLRWFIESMNDVARLFLRAKSAVERLLSEEFGPVTVIYRA